MFAVLCRIDRRRSKSCKESHQRTVKGLFLWLGFMDEIIDSKCSRCGLVKPAIEFSKCSARWNKLQAYCRLCASSKYKNYSARNRQDIASRMKKYISENKHSVSIQRAGYYIRNREERIAYSSDWEKKNKSKGNARRSKRRAAKLLATVKWADPGLIHDFYRRAYALSKLTNTKYEVDHIVPLLSEIVCGLHCEANLQIISKSENIKKGNRSWPDMP